ncbi:MAG: hypothetical protein HYZ50_02405 [Deltaproteobacteria bacterium]|nr:hypothetical protein [Deltaproteobacteria bacterium]
MSVGTFLIVVAVLAILALSIRPLRKTIGLLTVILGFLACLTGIGMLLGITMIFVGGMLLFV